MCSIPIFKEEFFYCAFPVFKETVVIGTEKIAVYRKKTASLNIMKNPSGEMKG